LPHVITARAAVILVIMAGISQIMHDDILHQADQGITTAVLNR